MSFEKTPTTPPSDHKESLPRHASTVTDDTVVGHHMPFKPHTVPASKVTAALEVDPKIGLSEDEAARRLAIYGPNRLKPPAKPSMLKIFARQVGNAMTLVLSE